MIPIGQRTATPATPDRRGRLVAVFVGVALGIALRQSEDTAEALSPDCGDSGRWYELAKFERLSGSGDVALEAVWWRPFAVLFTEESSLGLQTRDDTYEPEHELDLEAIDP